MIVCVSGNPAIDKLFEVEDLVPGAVHRPDRFVPLPGGKGIHVAQVATALGAQALATGILGGHAGRWLAETREAAHEVRRRAGGDGHAAVVTLGEQGMVLVEPAGAIWHGTVAVRGDYPVGSGDAFLAGLLTALTHPPGAAWHDAARLALGAAA